MSDLISVIVPIYKVEPYLPRCIDSILAQTYNNLEIFLVDDGSPDNCGRICDEYAAKDARIKVIHKKNGGLSDARNTALDLCTGEYISFIDSDDYVDADFIESLYHAIKTYDARLAVCGITKFNESGKVYVDYEPSKTEKCASGEEMMETVWRPAAWNKLYHRSLFRDIRYPYGKLYEDLFVYHDILAKVDHVAFTGKNSYFYNNRQNSIINKKYDIRNTDMIEGLDLRIRKLREMRYDKLADRQLPILFGQTMEAFNRISAPSEAEEKRLKQVKQIFDQHYREMMHYDGFSEAQKAKITAFRYFPGLYSKFIKSGL